MSEYVDKLRETLKYVTGWANHDAIKQAADHLEACEKLLAAYYASHSDPKFGPCDCEACLGYRKARGE